MLTSLVSDGRLGGGGGLNSGRVHILCMYTKVVRVYRIGKVVVKNSRLREI